MRENLWNRQENLFYSSLSKDVFEQRTLTRSGLFSSLGSGFVQIFGQIVSISVKTRSNTNSVVSRNIKRGKTHLPVNVLRSKTPLLKLPCLTGVGTQRIPLTLSPGQEKVDPFARANSTRACSDCPKQRRRMPRLSRFDRVDPLWPGEPKCLYKEELARVGGWAHYYKGVTQLQAEPTKVRPVL